MLILLATCFGVIIWLIYFKWKLLPYDRKNKILSTTIGFLLLTVIFLIMLMVTPYSKDFMIQGKINQLAPRVSGNIEQIFITPGEVVPQGAPLFQLGKHDLTLKVKEAEGTLRSAQAAFDRAEKQREIAKALQAADPESISKIQLINADEALNQAKGQLESAKNNLEQAKSNLTKTTVYAPSEGFTPYITFSNETPVTAYTPVMTFISTTDPFPMASFNQNAVSMMEPGNRVEFILDIYPGHVFSGEVMEILWAAGEAQVGQGGTLAQVSQISVPREYFVKIKPDATGDEFPLRYAARGQAVIYTNHWKPLHIIQKVHIRMIAWLKYLAFP